MESLFDCVKTFCLTQGTDKIYRIAYSGGLDSHVLLHVCATLRKHYAISFKAIHINHGLSSNATDWALHCATVCRELDIEFTTHAITIAAMPGDSPEALARDLRYKTLSNVMDVGDILLTAHHQDDQAETVLLQLLRGAGPKGLAAMPIIKRFAQGFHGRPFLTISHATLEKYANYHGLRWIEDESNQNTDFSRNYLRHDVLPVLKKRWPSVTDTLSRVAEHCAEAQDLIDGEMNRYLAASKNDLGLSITALLALSSSVQRHVLRLWLSHLSFPIPSVVKMQQIQNTFLQAAPDKLPHITWGSVELRRYQDTLYAMKKLVMHDEHKIYEWDVTQPLTLPNIGILHAVLTPGQGLRINISRITVRFRQGGECCRLPGRAFHHNLKKLFQQWGVPPWERSRVPLLFHNNTLIAVVGYFIDAEYVAKAGEKGWVYKLVPQTSL